MTSWPQRYGQDYLMPVEHAPAAYVEEMEGRLVANAAQAVHKMGGQFDGWPAVTREPVRYATPQELAVDGPFVRCPEEHATHLHIRVIGKAVPR